MVAAFERLKPDDPPGGSRNQAWKFQLEPGVIVPATDGGLARSRV